MTALKGSDEGNSMVVEAAEEGRGGQLVGMPRGSPREEEDSALAVAEAEGGRTRSAVDRCSRWNATAGGKRDLATIADSASSLAVADARS